MLPAMAEGVILGQPLTIYMDKIERSYKSFEWLLGIFAVPEL
jgi:hypothetical protein